MNIISGLKRKIQKNYSVGNTNYKEKLQKLINGDYTNLDFSYSYVDFQGHTLTSNKDVYFSNRRLLNKLADGENLSAEQLKEQIEQNSVEQYLYDLEDLEYIPEKKFFCHPETEEIMDLKISRYSGQLLPVHAGQVFQFSVQYFGLSNAGKTVLMTQYAAENAMFAERRRNGWKFSWISDTPVNIPIQNSKEEAIRLYASKKLMPPTLTNEELLPYSFYVSYYEKNLDQAFHALIEFTDLAGENSINQLHESPVYQSDYLLFLIDPLTLEDDRANFELQQVITLVNQMRGQNGLSKVAVVLTMSDIFRDPIFEDVDELQQLLDSNTIRKDRRIKLITHKEGYDMEVHRQRSAIVENFLQERYPNIFSLLESLEKEIQYFLVASINEQPLEGNLLPDNFEPYRIDEPLLYILGQYQLYPILDDKEVIESDEEYDGQKQFRNRLLERMNLL